MQMEPVPAIPVVLAAEYIREYVQQDGGFGGVMCYVGDHDPAGIKKGGSIRVPKVAYTDKGEFYVEVRERDFHEARELPSGKQAQCVRSLQRLQSANAWYENDSQRMNVNDTHRELARVARGGRTDSRIAAVGDAGQYCSMEKQPDPMPQLRFDSQVMGAILCVNCRHIFST